MASSTTNLDLTLPVGGENVSRQIINANNVKIDEAVGAVPSGTDLQSQVTALNNNITKHLPEQRINRIKIIMLYMCGHIMRLVQMLHNCRLASITEGCFSAHVKTGQLGWIGRNLH